MKVNNGMPGVDIGSNHDKIAFWAEWVEYNELYVAKYYKMSDIRVKLNIKDITWGLQKLMQIRPVHYSIINNMFDSSGAKIEGSQNQYGFISQEIEKDFPEVKITDDFHGYKLMDYDQIIPITVAAIQEQQKTIDSLKIEIVNLKEQINSKNSFRLGNNDSTTLSSRNVLKQNSPNPFNEHTEIKFSIDEHNFRNASILIFDLNGLLIKQYDIQKGGDGSIQINGNELKAGMYIYTLLVNQREVDSKKMILLN
ncbi:MAG: tail fiber domain-containing protein [Brumimicrobium sp.]|nr:tail fiber domain-containing protein [Brumimicrobium sp.]